MLTLYFYRLKDKQTYTETGKALDSTETLFKGTYYVF